MKRPLPAFGIALSIGCCLCLALLGGAFCYFDLRANAPGDEEGDVEFEVRKGATVRSVAGQLQEVGLVDSPLVFRFAAWRQGHVSLKAGKFRLARTLSARQLVVALEQPPRAEDEPVVVVEGWRLRDVDEALAAQGRIEAGMYLEAARDTKAYQAPFGLPSTSLEGYLYPETYALPKGRIDARQLVQKQLDQFASRVFEPLEQEIRASKRSLHELVTMASMLEREEPVPANRPLVAGILWKRIDRGFPLGVDATSRYELAQWNDRLGFLAKLRDGTDLYNTRVRPGLPPSPIGSQTRASFEAALRPTASDYLYYLHDAQRQLHPSKDAQGHEALRQKYGVY